jgi:hypothetical protein
MVCSNSHFRPCNPHLPALDLSTSHFISFQRLECAWEHAGFQHRGCHVRSGVNGRSPTQALLRLCNAQWPSIPLENNSSLSTTLLACYLYREGAFREVRFLAVAATLVSGTAHALSVSPDRYQQCSICHVDSTWLDFQLPWCFLSRRVC